jgi:hypothetical protein
MKAELRNVGGSNTAMISLMAHSAGYPMSAIILNPSAGTVFLGHQGVTTANGFPLRTDQSIEVDLVNENLFGVATVTTTINILRRGD